MTTRRTRGRLAAALGALVVAASGWLAACWMVLLHPASEGPKDADVRLYLSSSGGWTALRAATASGAIREGTVAVSRPASVASNPIFSVCGLANVRCFTPDVETTRGEASAFARLAREQGWRTVNIATHQTQAARARWLFDACLGPGVSVDVIPTPTTPRLALAEFVHETGGWAKVALEGACR